MGWQSIRRQRSRRAREGACQLRGHSNTEPEPVRVLVGRRNPSLKPVRSGILAAASPRVAGAVGYESGNGSCKRQETAAMSSWASVACGPAPVQRLDPLTPHSHSQSRPAKAGHGSAQGECCYRGAGTGSLWEHCCQYIVGRCRLSEGQQGAKQGLAGGERQGGSGRLGAKWRCCLRSCTSNGLGGACQRSGGC